MNDCVTAPDLLNLCTRRQLSSLSAVQAPALLAMPLSGLLQRPLLTDSAAPSLLSQVGCLHWAEVVSLRTASYLKLTVCNLR